MKRQRVFAMTAVALAMTTALSLLDAAPAPATRPAADAAVVQSMRRLNVASTFLHQAHGLIQQAKTTADPAKRREALEEAQKTLKAATAQIKAGMDVMAEIHESSGGDTWSCPMHPHVISERGGPCPICQMRMDKGRFSAEETKSLELWTCLMHPQIVTEKPGSCPICRMGMEKMRPEKVKPALPAEERKPETGRAGEELGLPRRDRPSQE